MDKISWKKKVLKGTTVLLITAVMVLSTTAVTANIEKAESGVGSLDINLLDEGFEAPWVPDGNGDLAPPDWEVEDKDYKHTWTSVGSPVHSGSKAAQCSPWGSSTQREWLISPEIELDVGYDEVTLTFWCYSRVYTSQEGTVKLYVDRDNDGFDDPDDVIWDMTLEESWEYELWREKIFDLTEYVGNTIRIAWYYYEDGPTDLYSKFTLDDVTISTPGFLPKTTIDIGKIGGGFGTIYAEIKNTGDITARGITWSISVEGGIKNRINEKASGEIDKIKAVPGRDTEIRSTDSFFGLGMVDIQVTAEAENADEQACRNATGFVFLFKFFPCTWNE